MRRGILIHRLLDTLLLTALWFGTSAPMVGQSRPVVRQADHLQIETTDPRDLFDFFADTLRLPVASPFVINGSYAGGEVGIGNLMLQVFRVDDTGHSPTASRQARYAGLALEPYSLSDSLKELRLRGILHGAPRPYIATLPDKSQGTLWTTVVLTGLARTGIDVFLYEYSPAFLNVYVRRNQLAGQLALRKGGPLGVESAGEIVLSSNDLRRDTPLWQKLFAPVIPTAPRLWKVGNGPAIRLVSGRSTRIERVVLLVKSLARARLFLQQQEMLGTTGADSIAILPARVQGLDIRLKEVRGH